MIASNPAEPRNSLLSSLPPRKVQDLPRQFLLDELERYYGAKPPAQSVEVDYSLWECAETGLQFAWPMQPGNACFYEWVSSFSSYYPGRRWEYGKVASLLHQQEVPGDRLNVLDVGCGSGKFLRSLESVPVNNRFGVDLNEPAIEDCRKLGFNAYCGTVEAALRDDFLQPKSFSAVTAFHCLEHVPDPVGFMRSLVTITKPGGRIFVSTPYSPMSFEAVRFDIMNHPPHHMTRWNLAAFHRLADLLGVKMQYYAPFSPALRAVLRIYRSLNYPPKQAVPLLRLCADALFDLPKILALYRQQKDRVRKNGGIDSDVILIEFRAPAS